MGGGGSSSKPQMVKDPTLEPLRQDLVGFFRGATSGGLSGLSLPQYGGAYGASNNPIWTDAMDMAQNAIRGMGESMKDIPLDAAFKRLLGGETTATDDVVADIERRGREAAGLATGKLNEQFSAAGMRFASPLATASASSMRGIADDTLGRVANVQMQAKEAAMNRMAGALAPGVEYVSSGGQQGLQALAALRLGEAAIAPEEREIDRRMTEFARTQAALLPFAIQMASAYPPVGSKTSEAHGGILAS